MEDLENKIGSPKDEIEKLKKRIAELENNGNISGDLTGKVIVEHIERGGENVKEGYLLSDSEIKRHAQEIQKMAPRIKDDDTDDDGVLSTDKNVIAHEKECAEQLEELVQYAKEKGILNAVSVVKHIGNPHLTDEFHKKLVKLFQEGGGEI